MGNDKQVPQVRDAASDEKSFQAMLGITSLVKHTRVTANWLPDGRLWYAEGAPIETHIKVFDPDTRTVSELFDIHAVRAALSAAIGHELPYSGLPFEQFYFSPDGLVRFTFDGTDYSYDAAAGAIVAATRPGLAEQMFHNDPKTLATPNMMQRPAIFPDMPPVPEPMSPDGKHFASLKEGDIYIRAVSDGGYHRLTSDAEPGFGWDIESTRMGVSGSGQVTHLTVNPWAPDGTRLYATHYDERRVQPRYRIRYLRHFEEVEGPRAARAGDALPHAQPYVFNVFSGDRVKLDIDAHDAFVLLLGWNDAGDGLFLCRISRDMKRAEMLFADSATGSTRTLFSEQCETFLRLQHEVLGGSSGCTVLPNGEGFLWESERDGWKHLYHYGLDGKLVRQLTQGQWPVEAVLDIDPKAGWVYFSARLDPDRPYDLHIARVPLAGGGIEQLTHEPGLHDAQFAPDFSWFVDTVQRPDLPPRSRAIGVDGTVWHEFPEADTRAMEAAGWTAPEEFVVKAADGETDLHGVLYKPRDFDPAKRYPVIEYLYGGPQAAMVEHKFLPISPLKMLALNYALPQLGYIVAVVDARGTPLRSKAFQDEVYGNWRRSVTADHAAALRNLAAERPWMDLDRVGLWGHSWGGYFTIANMLDNPDLYRAGVASAPGVDPYGYFIYEPYLGGVPSPSTKAAYEDAVLPTDAGKLQGALMMVAGTNDIGVCHDAIKMSNALIEAGKFHETVLLPNQHHGYATAHEIHFIKKLVRHFDRYLQRGEEIRL